MSATCRSCRAPILWARSEKSGKMIPLDPEPRFGGNVDLREPTETIGTMRRAAELVAHFITKAERERRPYYVAHFSTCPNAKSHRRSA